MAVVHATAELPVTAANELKCYTVTGSHVRYTTGNTCVPETVQNEDKPLIGSGIYSTPCFIKSESLGMFATFHSVEQFQ